MGDFRGVVNVEYLNGRIKKIYGIIASEVFESLFGEGLIYRSALDHTVAFKRFRENPARGFFVYEKLF